MRKNMLRRAGAVVAGVGLCTAVGVGASAFPAGAAHTTETANTSTVQIPYLGSANPYPSTINVSGTGRVISDLTVELTNVEHGCSKDLDILLVGPDGTRTTLMSDVGEVAIPLPDPTSCNDLRKTVIFSDAGSHFGTSIPAGNPIVVRPSDNDALGHQPDVWPGVGFEVPARSLSIFDGKNPNGHWRLYVVDDAAGDRGTIGGWKVNITTSDGPPSGELAGCDTGSSHLQRYVCRVYLDKLGRPAEPAGKDYWVNRINSGQPRYEILNSFSRTQEYREQASRRIFRSLLGRDAAANERTYWAGQLRSKNPDAVRAGIVGSPEFLSQAGGIDGWAPAMYQQLLHRPATQAEADAAKSAVTTGGRSRGQVAAELLTTPEADTVTVQGIYEHYLRRTPPTSETNYWVGRLQSGAFETRMVVEIVAAPEYFNQP